MFRRERSTPKRKTSPGRLLLEALEDRLAPAAVSWNGNAANFLWGDKGNWSNNQVPTSSDDVTISINVASPIIVGGGSFAVRSLNDTTALLMISSNGTLALAAVAANSTFGKDVTVDGSLTIGTGAGVLIKSGVIMTVTGSMAVTSPGSFLIDDLNNFTSGIVVNGVLTVTNTTFARHNNSNGSDITKIEVKSGGHLTTTNTANNHSVFGWDQFLLDEGSVLNSGDLTGDAFDTTVFTPAAFVPLLTNNLRFQDVDIDAVDTLTSGQTVSFTQMGTQNTTNLRYVFPGIFTVAAGASLTVDPGTSVLIRTGAILTDTGSMTINAPASFLIEDVNNFSTVEGIVVNGVLNVINATFGKVNNTNGNDITKIEVKSGGHLSTANTSGSNSVFGWDQFLLDEGCVLTNSDLIGNAFDTTIFTPAAFVPLLTNNLRFQDVNIDAGDVLASGQAIAFTQMGTQTSAALRYVIPGAFKVSVGASLTLDTGINVLIRSGAILTDSGSLTVNSVASLTVEDINNFSSVLGIVVTGSMTVTNTSFTRLNNTNGNDISKIEVKSGGHLMTTNTANSSSVFNWDQLLLDIGSTLASGDLVGDAFDTTVFTPAAFVPLLTNNLRFQDVEIDAGDILASGQTCSFTQMGTQSTTSLRYVIPGSFTVAAGATLTMATGINVLIKSGAILNDTGTLTVTAPASFAVEDINDFSAVCGIIVNGMLTVTNTTFARLNNTSGNDTSKIEVKSGGHLNASDSTFALDLLKLDSGSNDTIQSVASQTNLTLDSHATIAITSNDFSNVTATVVATGAGSDTITLINNYWGTTDPVAIGAKITDHLDNSALPTVVFTPLLAAKPSTTTAADASVNFHTASQNVTLSAVVSSPSGVVNVGSVTFTILNGGTQVGNAASGLVVNGVASASYALPAGLAGNTYTIQAVYSDGSGNFLGSSDNGHSLTVHQFMGHLAVTNYPTTTTAGQSHTFTVTAQDTGGNTAPGYTGTVHFTSSDANATLPADSVLVNGIGTFSATLTTAGLQSLTATDADDNGVTGTQTSIMVNPDVATHLSLSGFPSSTTAGVSGAFTVSAKDAFGNTATGYSGTLHFTSNDPQAVLPADTSLTNGSGSFNATLKTAGSRSITATDTSNSAFTSTESGISVAAAAASKLTVAGFPNPAIARAPGTLTVSAQDSFGNTVTSYAGTVHFSSSDSLAVLPPDATLTNGTGSFSATLKSFGTQSITATDTVSSSITGSQMGISVGPGAATQLVLTGLPASSTAGTGLSFTVTAQDIFGNTATGYSGTVHFSSTDPQAVRPADSTLSSGVGMFTITLKTAGLRSVTATDTSNSTLTVTQSGINVSAAAASRFAVSGFPNPATVSVPATFTVTAQDPFGNTAASYTGTVHLSSSDGAAALPPDAALTNGTGSFSATLKTVGTQSLTATDTLDSSITGSQTGISVVAGVATQVVVTGFVSTVTAGNSGSFTVTAEDAFGNRATGYSGTMHFSSSDPQAVLPTDMTLFGGIGTFTATLKTAGAQQITATDVADHSLSASQTGILVNPGPVNRLLLTGLAASATAGAQVPFTVTAQDAFGNNATGYSGPLHFSSSDTLAVLPPDSSLTNGTGNFSVAFGKVGTQTLTAADNVNSALSAMQNIAVNPGAVARFAVAGLPSTTTAGQSSSFTVTAQDMFGNTVTGYTGTVHFSSSDPQANLPANTTLTNGAGTFTATLKTASFQSVAVTDTANSAITGSQVGVAVSAAAASQLAITGFTGPVTAGDQSSITVTALDPFGNTATSYSGTVHFSSDDPQAVLPPDSLLMGGVGSFAATLKTAGSKSVSVTDTKNPVLSVSRPAIPVNAAAPTSLAITGLHAALKPGAPATLTLSARDDFGNVATSFTGVVHFTSSDASATLPANFTFTSSDAGMHTFTATFHTSGTQSVTATDTANASHTVTASTLVDGIAPTSTVTALPSFSSTAVTLAWSGSDNTGGSGIAAFDILVSDNGGAFTPLLTGTTATTTSFTGQDGHTYAFDSLATDQAGNRQAMPASPQATTTVDITAPISAVRALSSFSPNSFTVNWSGSDGGSGIASFDILVSDNGGSFTPFLTGTTQTSAAFQGQTDHIYGFVSVATDHAGNRQTAATAAQASTQVALPPPSSLPQVAGQITHSVEHFQQFVTSAYQTYLGHGPDQAGLNGWVHAMQNGLTDEQLEANFIGSSEFINHNGGLRAGWVTAMYQDLLGRAPSQAEINSWLAAIQHGVSPANIALGFAASPEREGNRVSGDYQTFLGRSPSQSEVTSWVNAFSHGLTNENLAAGFLGSAEYYNSPSKGKGDSLDWIASATQDELSRAPTANEIAQDQTALLPAALSAVSNQITHSTEHFQQFVTHAYQTFLGHGPDQASLNGWVQAMQNGLTDEQLEANFIGSAEFINANGGLGAGWVRAMYQNLLGRAPTQSEVDAWVAALSHGTSAAAIALGFATSAEREGHRVQDDYFTFLGRAASQSEVNGWVNAFSHGLTNENLSAGFIGAQEYYTATTKGRSNKVDWLTAAVQDVLGRQLTADEFTSWGTALQ